VDASSSHYYCSKFAVPPRLSFFAWPATKRQKLVECRLIQHRRRPSNPAILLFSRPVINGIRIYPMYLPVSEVFHRFNGLSDPISTSYAQKKGKLRKNSEFGPIVPLKKSSGFWVLMLSVRNDWLLSRMGPRLSERPRRLRTDKLSCLTADRVN
jgi:hypothetical protein